MARRITLIALFAIVVAVFAQSASPDPLKARHSTGTFTLSGTVTGFFTPNMVL